jgi:two-component system, NtrC family, sensor kinase
MMKSVLNSDELNLPASLFRRLVEEIDDALAIWGLEGEFSYLSPGFRNQFGYTPSDWIGKCFTPLVHSDDLAVCAEVNQRAIDTGESQPNVLFRHRHQDGRWIWVSLNIVPLKDDAGKVVALQGMLQNIHESKQREDALRLIVEGTVAKQGEEFFRACVQHLAESCQVKYAFMTELLDDRQCRARMLSLWTGEGFVEPYEFDLVDTPCQVVVRETWGVFPSLLQSQFPKADALATLNAESYVGVAIASSRGNVIGNLGIIHTEPLSGDLDTIKFILQLFATRVGAELERQSSEVALRRSEVKFRDIIENVNDMISLITADGIFTYCSPQFLAIMGYQPDELVNSSFAPFVYPEDITVCQIALQLALEGQKINRVEYRVYHKDGSLRWHQATLSPLKDESSISVICAARDITLQQQQSQQLESTLKELQQTQAQMIQSEKMSSLGQLVAGIAHEINNPVSFIHGNVTHAGEYAQELLELIALYQQAYPEPTGAIAAKLEEMDLDFLCHDLSKLLESMQVGTERIREIVKSLRLFSRLDEAEVKAVDLHDGLESTLMILESRFKAQQIEVIKTYGELPKVECFAGQLNQVFMNVLVNAIEALEEVIEPTIRISTVLVEQSVEIRITDNGVGIPDEIQHRIFDPFFTTKPVGKGTGMGMSTSYQIVTEKHGGQLFCHSTLGKGSEFVIQIPLKAISS